MIGKVGLFRTEILSFLRVCVYSINNVQVVVQNVPTLVDIISSVFLK